MADSIFIPVGFGTQVVRDSSGRCFELSGFVEVNQSIDIEDTSAYDIEEQEICCEECEDKKTTLEDVIIAEPSSSKSSLSSSKSSLTSLYSSSKSGQDDYDYSYEYDGYYYGYSTGGDGTDEDISCSDSCCTSDSIEFGFTKEECETNLELLLGLVGNVCADDCGPPTDENEWGLCSPAYWFEYGKDIEGVWSCGFCCDARSSSSKSSESSVSSKSSKSSYSSKSSAPTPIPASDNYNGVGVNSGTVGDVWWNLRGYNIVKYDGTPPDPTITTNACRVITTGTESLFIQVNNCLGSSTGRMSIDVRIVNTHNNSHRINPSIAIGGVFYSGGYYWDGVNQKLSVQRNGVEVWSTNDSSSSITIEFVWDGINVEVKIDGTTRYTNANVGGVANGNYYPMQVDNRAGVGGNQIIDFDNLVLEDGIGNSLYVF